MYVRLIALFRSNGRTELVFARALLHVTAEVPQGIRGLPTGSLP
jgi:hypothetical protein